jgi:hypothetical protein
MILVTINHPSLRVGCHNWYQSNYRCNTSHTSIFSKAKCLQVRIHVYAHIRTIVLLIGSNLTGFYFPYLLSKTYYSITTHLRLGKKVSYATDCDETSEAHLVRGRSLWCPIQ